ncbi:MAG TPA: hemerythrin domain-containing protein [Phenylobacterium sp.]
MSPVRKANIEDMPLPLLAEPLEWFFAEHFRHRQLCDMIDEAAASVVFDGERISRIVDFLRHDLALHVIDEEEDLFPLLRRRCKPEDELERILGVLSAEHRIDVDFARTVRTHLERCLEQQSAPGLDPQVRKAMTEFASQERRHLGLENAVVLPIARLRLTKRDLDTLGRRLAARRGLLLAEARS